MDSEPDSDAALAGRPSWDDGFFDDSLAHALRDRDFVALLVASLLAPPRGQWGVAAMVALLLLPQAGC